MKRTLISLAGAVGLAVAQPAIETPLIGYMQDKAGTLHAVLGTAGNFVLGPVMDAPLESRHAATSRIERRGSTLYILDPDGGVADILPPEAQAALLIENGVVYSTPNEIVVKSFRDKEIHFPAQGVTILRRMSADYVQAGADRQFAVRVERDREALFVLPKLPDVAPRRKEPANAAPPDIPWRSRQQ